MQDLRTDNQLPPRTGLLTGMVVGFGGGIPSAVRAGAAHGDKAAITAIHGILV